MPEGLKPPAWIVAVLHVDERLWSFFSGHPTKEATEEASEELWRNFDEGIENGREEKEIKVAPWSDTAIQEHGDHMTLVGGDTNVAMSYQNPLNYTGERYDLVHELQANGSRKEVATITILDEQPEREFNALLDLDDISSLDSVTPLVDGPIAIKDGDVFQLCVAIDDGREQYFYEVESKAWHLRSHPSSRSTSLLKSPNAPVKAKGITPPLLGEKERRQDL